nr:CPPV348 ankyrin repeat protein [Cooks petrelpox virus]
MSLDIFENSTFNSNIRDRLLFNCVKANDYEIIEILLYHQVDINSTSCASCVCYAANNGDEETIKLFLQKGFDPNTKDEKGNVALHYAVLSNYSNITQLLFEYNANIKECNPFILLHAVKSNNIDITSSLLKHGIDANIISDEGYTALHYSIENNNVDITKLLLYNGANIGVVNRYSFINNIIRFRFANYNNMIDLLLEYGADANNINDYYAPIHLAVDNEDEKILKLLISHGADINMKDTYNSSSPLHHAIKNINTNILKILLDNGADVDSRNRYGCTPIYYAICDNNFDVVNILLEYGADVNVVDSSGNTPLTVSGNNYIKKIIISRIIISKYLNKLVESKDGYKANIDFIYSDKRLVNIKIACENEITALKTTKINSSNLLECFINKDINSVSRSIDNDLIKDYKKHFPIYNTLIEDFISESIRRQELLNEVKNKVVSSLPGFNNELSCEIQYII